ncbi:MAG TPA: hypothetical protein DIT64_14810 [Verrucomicrobiales bacterium]|nr:hypothetical protein [Verrucomicrobiales bacterium]HCN77515.1 hypothetical protein [Verrucomicrobiales bacterium]HRJ07916.1 hypothetical protein [Prosthecobacter sp.]HRK16187.1 hypothetical protein [Prosthecobacter sp.]
MSRPSTLSSVFERVYSLDVVFQPECWKLCGDAHCCSFARHKERFRLLGRMGPPAQELPLLPGEYDFLHARGWTAQFHGHERKLAPFDFGPAVIHLDTITSTRPHCACDHDTRTTVCRLYPLLPVFDTAGALVSTEPLGIYEELEILDGLAPACRLDSLPFSQLNLYLELAALLGAHPVARFHLMAYRLVKRHVAERVRNEKNAGGRDAFAVFEAAYMRRKLLDQETLKAALAELWEAFVSRHGADFTDALAELRKACPPGAS